jgi:hypothetical protein
MTARFTLGWEADHSLMVVRVHGFWTEQDVQVYKDSVLNLIRLHRISRFEILVDLGMGLPQTALVSALLADVIGVFVRRGLYRAATISQSAIVRTQASRMSPVESKTGIFTDESAARQWLAAKRSADAAAKPLLLQE